jgi:hypothetical protein
MRIITNTPKEADSGGRFSTSAHSAKSMRVAVHRPIFGECIGVIVGACCPSDLAPANPSMRRCGKTFGLATRRRTIAWLLDKAGRHADHALDGSAGDVT